MSHSGADDGPLIPRTKRRDDSEMDITPMIDITFLLLIFFLVASKMDSSAQTELPDANNGTAVTEKNSAFLTMLPGNGGTAKVYIGNGAVESERITAADLADREEVIVEYVTQMLFDEGKEQVIIKAGKKVKHREVASVLRAIGKVEGAKAFVAVMDRGGS